MADLLDVARRDVHDMNGVADHICRVPLVTGLALLGKDESPGDLNGTIDCRLL